ncbi:MAG: amidase [Pseudomonadota bacterium]
MTPETYARLDAIDIATEIRAGRASWQEVAEVALHVIDALNPKLNAMIMDDRDRAMKAGPDGDGASSLHGAPFLLKDVNQTTAHMPTTYSCAFFADAKPSEDSTLVRRWRDAGLIILGKANTPEFAEDFVTEPTFRGATLNPWNIDRTVGGSSGGAGSAVAAGLVPFAHGTDLGGSIRIPAACCGVFGLKPSAGLMPNGPALEHIALGLNSDHVLSRSVRDSAAALDAGCGPEPGQRYPVRPRVPSYLTALDQPPSSLAIGLALEPPGAGAVDDEMAAAAERLARLLEGLGHRVQSLTLPKIVPDGDWYELLWIFDIATEMRAQTRALGCAPRPEELEAFTRHALTRAANCTGQELYDAQRALHANAVALDRAQEPFDLLITPALGSDPVPLGSIDARSLDFDYWTWAAKGYGFAPFSIPFNITGQPAASLPVETSKAGLPLAVQIAAAKGDDHLLLALAHQIEAKTGWRDNHPPLWAGNL